MHIYHNNVYEFGEKLWSKSPKWPLIGEALTEEKSIKKGERHAYISALMRRWSVPWRG
ncbi:hypothetical protein OCC_13635 [Thermococcus litoralis DSM 5473]|uniref:Uncharacterized protein n=1 Tax=Thermococcus litoralis (strain ATCC 51850 / DSM 5473 / JCM 8560 / NS-C) TaxID=523849 RepID=S5ZTM4_THELN|nr:hypothetical protein [Thermococcus litoralis]AGT34219.1 hypothetical protein OCC_13635 [Thermococcus litoralis DSM 5473]